MSERKPEWPETSDLEIATIENVMDYGAVVKLGEFGKRGLLHVSNSWKRNIRDFVLENQKMKKVVAKVTKAGVVGSFKREK